MCILSEAAESQRGVYPLSSCIFYLFTDLKDVLQSLVQYETFRQTQSIFHS